ncbi:MULTISPECIES: trigger factor [Streptomyces]|uniref:Trigger factor n=1 Tax=Streptomyces tsukubensis (strain DSM 42081 / NBRC 108919 / NRRL 18488 / 9993) TaxID=1114943 RepID=I2MY73_STRT9|nr:trigger factor [Streptomyces tsukubensis]MYS62680.1 trigger factor [Streptomyces sp. SID5473]AZK94067.1 trigger factor [Streptomyces tsukubensis]EIF89720.1 trigger factor [Streptomyces tsukubensis NRRL18488]QKM69819.1 trigger factor [Streptomyces tsukubensis NRRL18488]TAI46207.1 trigger factor [Streptomyces tsukubensis]
MKSAVETLNPTRVRLTVEVPFEELKDSLDAAYKKINQQVTVKGFRKGKIPARVIDQRFGRGAVLEEAVNDALPKFYSEAVREAEINPLGQPEVDITELKDGETLNFTAEVDVRPEIEIPDYSGIEVEVDAVEVTDEDIDKSVEQLRERFVTTTPVERAAADGDTVTVDLEAKVDGEVLADGVASDVSYTIGSGELLDGIDDAVKGLEAGGEATFTSELKGGSAAGKEAEVTVKVTQVSARELPALDDDFAQLASEFDTFEELRADSRKRLENMKAYDQATQAQERVLDELLKITEVPIPEKLLEDEVNTRKHNLEHHQLGQMGLDLEKYLEIQGKTVEEFENESREQAIKGIKTQFVLDELVSKEKLNVSQEELTEHLMRRAASSGMSPDQFAQAVVEGGQVPMLVGEVARGKALAVVVEAAKVVDTNGEVVDLDDEDETETAAEAVAATVDADADADAEKDGKAEA